MKKFHPILNIFAIVAIFLMISTTIGCGGCDGGGQTTDLTDPDGQTDQPTGGDESHRLICEEMLSPDFQSNHSLSIKKDDRNESPIDGQEEIATNCMLIKNDEHISSVVALNSNSATYDTYLADVQSNHLMTEDNSVGTKSAYGYSEDGLELLTFVFLGSNQATTVMINQMVPTSINLEEARALAREIDLNLPDVDPLADTTQNITCPDVITEPELSAIFDHEAAYTSLEPENIANNQTCHFEGPDTDNLLDKFSGHFSMYCTPAQGQISTEERFKVTEDAILAGSAEVVENVTAYYEDAQALPEVGPKAYYYMFRSETEYNGEIHSLPEVAMVAFIHSTTNCYFELMVSDPSNTELVQEMIAAAKRINEGFNF